MNELSTIDCPHFGPCSGCSLSSHVKEPPIWNDVQLFFDTVCENPPKNLETAEICGWRTKAKLAVRGTIQEPEIGLFHFGTHRVMPIPHCKVHHPAINQAVAYIRNAIIKAKISPYDEKHGALRYIQCFVEIKTGLVGLTFVWNAVSETPEMIRLVNELQKQAKWHSIWFNFQPFVTNRIFGDRWQHIWGSLFVIEPLGSIEIPFHPAAFSQAHWSLFQKLAWQVQSWVPEGAHLAEIYSGVGAMGLLAASKCSSVALIENNPFAYLSFQSMIVPSHVLFYCQEAAQAVSFLNRANCVIVDPPRKGVDAALLNALERWNGTLIYVSCDFHSFQRDANQLRKSGWKLTQARGYLLFPGTNHVEIAALFQK